MAPSSDIWCIIEIVLYMNLRVSLLFHCLKYVAAVPYVWNIFTIKAGLTMQLVLATADIGGTVAKPVGVKTRMKLTQQSHRSTACNLAVSYSRVSHIDTPRAAPDGSTISINAGSGRPLSRAVLHQHHRFCPCRRFLARALEFHRMTTRIKAAFRSTSAARKGLHGRR